MTTLHNKAVLVEYFRAFGARDVEAMANCTSNDYEHEMLGSTVLGGKRSKQEMISLVSGLRSHGFSDASFKFHEVVAEGDYVSAIITSISELPTGERMDGLYCVTCRFRDGKIVVMRELLDTKKTDEVMARIGDRLVKP